MGCELGPPTRLSFLKPVALSAAACSTRCHSAISGAVETDLRNGRILTSESALSPFHAEPTQAPSCNLRLLSQIHLKKATSPAREPLFKIGRKTVTTTRTKFPQRFQLFPDLKTDSPIPACYKGNQE